MGSQTGTSLAACFPPTCGEFHQPNGTKGKYAGEHSLVPFSFTNKTLLNFVSSTLE
jgi:hypothetical protein